MKADSNDLEQGTPLSTAAFHILLSLAEGEKHGYAIMQDVSITTGGRLRLGPGTLYGAIKRMLASRLIEESETRPDPTMDDARRRYYRLTCLGERLIDAEAQRLAGLVSLAKKRGLTRRFAIKPA